MRLLDFRLPSIIRCIVLLWAAAATLPLAALAQADVVGYFLTWQRDPLTTITVNWVDLYEEAPATVWYRPRGTAEWQQQAGRRDRVAPSTLRVGRAELTGLTPGTDYEFALGAAEPTKAAHWFRTMPARLDRPVRFVEGGDMMHQREWVDAMNRQAGRLDPDFAVLGGDLAYENGVSASKILSWVESWHLHARGAGGRLIPMVVAIGNHEVRGGYKGKIPEDAPYFYGLFALPEDRSYHALDFGDYLSLMVLDSGHTQPVPGAQTEWLRRALAERTRQQFLFPLYHYPAYGSAKRMGNDLPSEGARSVEIRRHWVTLFEEFGVSAVFEHDHHCYKRTHRIWQNQRDDERGLLYLGDGAWGVGTRRVREPMPWYIAHWEARRHLFHVVLHGDGRAEVAAIDAAGEIFDRVGFDRSRTPPAP